MFGYLKQSTASQSRLVGPFVDDTDFKTLETGLTINNTDVKLSKNGATGVDKNSGGGTHRNNGMYSLTFDATDTDTVGELAGSISVSGALVVTFKFWVLEESIYDAMFGASAAGFDGNQRVDVGNWLGSAPNALQSGRVDSYAGALATGVITATSIASNAITSAKIAAGAIASGVIAAAELNNIADAILKRDWTAISGEAARCLLNAARFLRNKWVVSGGTLTVTKEDDSTTAWTASLVTTSGADPVTEVDPT